MKNILKSWKVLFSVSVLSLVCCYPVVHAGNEKILVGIDPKGNPVYSVKYTGSISENADNAMRSFMSEYLKIKPKLVFSPAEGRSLRMVPGLTEEKYKRAVLARLSENKLAAACSEFSTCIQDVLDRCGLENYLIAVGKDHTANLYKFKNEWFVADANIDITDPNHRAPMPGNRIAIKFSEYKANVKDTLGYKTNPPIGVIVPDVSSDIPGCSGVLLKRCACPIKVFFQFQNHKI